MAALFGHEAALFTPTGSMANQIALQLLVPPGRGAALRRRRARRHVRDRRRGGVRRHLHPHLAGRRRRPRPGRRSPAMIRPDGYFAVPTRAIAVEQTHNRGGGGVIPLATLRDAARGRRRRRAVALHCDGARIWHAHVADGVPLAAYGRLFDTRVGLPVQGAGRAGRLAGRRRRPSGSPRRGGSASGWAAACVRPASSPRPACTRCDHHIDRLAEDHARAARLAEALAPFGVLAGPVRTNIVPLDLPSPRWTRRRSARRRASAACWSRCSGRAPRGWSPTSTSTTPGSTGPSRRCPRSSAPDRRLGSWRMDRPFLRTRTVLVLDPPDARQLAAFYERLTGLRCRGADGSPTGSHLRPPERDASACRSGPTQRTGDRSPTGRRRATRSCRCTSTWRWAVG